MDTAYLKSERRKYNLSQSKIARMLNIHPAMVSQWETSKAAVPHQYAEKLKAFFTNLDENTISNIGVRAYRQQRHDTLLGQEPAPKQKQRVLQDVDSVSNLAKVQLESGKPKAIALFAGCGGLSLGLQEAGFQVVGHAEIEKGYRDIYESNFNNSALLGADVCTISNDEIHKWKDLIGEIDLLAGGPPCQGFSLAGKRDILDPRNRLYVDYIRITGALKPKVVLMENVKLLTTMKTPDGKMVTSDITDKFEEIGYEVAWRTINAKDYGIPQSRERVIFLAVRKDIGKNPIIPQPTHGPVGNARRLAPYLTFRHATHGLELLESGEKSATDSLHFAITHPAKVIEMLKVIPEGESAHNHPNPGMRPTSGFNTTYKRIRWDEPCSTITTNFSMISGSRNVHPQNTRSLTIREATRCQTFPDDFKFIGSWGTIRASIGNAVPPKLAKQLGDSIIRLLS